MPQYRRMDAPGGTFFLTLVTYERRPILAEQRAVAVLRAVLAHVRRERPFEVRGAVVLPDHIHFLWELPPGDTDFSTRVGLLKARFTRVMMAGAGHTDRLTPSRRRHREATVWQRRFWEHTIRDDDDYGRHMDYIHYNPVKHGRAACPHAWPYSSFHRWVQGGRYDPDWCCVCGGRIPVIPALEGVHGGE